MLNCLLFLAVRGLVSAESCAELVNVWAVAGRSWRAAGRLPRLGLLLSGVTPFREHCTSWETV